MGNLAQATVQAEQKTVPGHPQGMPLHGGILQHAAILPAITQVHSGILQRCSGGIECAECREKRLEREGMMQRAAVSAAPVNGVPPIVHEVLGSPGQPLDAGTRAFMEPRFGYDFSQVRVHAAVPVAIQAKLTVNKPGDKYEQEADQVAEQVMRMPIKENEPETSVPGRAQGVRIHQMNIQSEELHRQSEEDEELPEELDEDEELPEELDEDEELQEQPIEEGTLQAKESPGQIPSVSPGLQTRINSTGGGGQRLPDSVRTFMEPRFNHDFSQVRVHTDNEASSSAQQLNARAYTLGQHIYFDQDQYQPNSLSGRHLLAHELTHVIQQQSDSSVVQRRNRKKHRRLGTHRSTKKHLLKRKKRVPKKRPPVSRKITLITFNGSQVELFGSHPYKARAVSGLMPNHPKAKGVDYTPPKYQNMPDVGPIPEGDYYINPSEVETRPPGTFDPVSWGYYRTRLHEKLFTRIGRWFTSRTGGFYLHQDANHNGTAGCIGIWTAVDNKKIHSWIRKNSAEIPVEVRYP